MRRPLKYASVFALAVVAGSYVAFGPMGLDVLFPDDEQETATTQSGLAPPAPSTSNDEAQDYMVAERVASLDGWSAFLAAHPNGAHAQSATAKVEQLLLERGDSVTAASSNGASRDAGVPIGPGNPASSASEDAVPAPGAAAVSARDAKVASQESLPATPPAEGDVTAGTLLAALTPDVTCQRDEERLEKLRTHPSSDELVRFANQLGCPKLLPQIVSLIKSLRPTLAVTGVSADSPSDLQAENEAAHQAQPVARADVAASRSDESCERDEDRLARLRANPSSDEAQRIASELRCEALRPQLQRLIESLGSLATAPPANSPLAPASLVSQACAGERAALDRLRKEPTAEAAGAFWRDLKCEGLRPQIRLLLESLNVAPESVGSSAVRGEAGQHDSSSDASGPSSADPVTCRRETAELNRIGATPDLGDAKRFTSAMTCAALKPQAMRLLESLRE